MEDEFIFPDGLEGITDKRLGIKKEEWEIFLESVRGRGMEGRITDITIKGGSCYTMQFMMDGRKSGKTFLSKKEMAWLDAGRITAFELAVHYGQGIKYGFKRESVQRNLFSF